MKYADINKRYTEIISEYMAAGYTLNSSTMTGSQGETASIDLTDGKEIIRVLVSWFNDWGDNASFEGVDIIAGRADLSERITPNNDSTWGTIWNDRLQVLRKERFYQVGESRQGNKFYGTQKEAEAAYLLRFQRYKSKREVKAQAAPTEKMQEVARRVVREKLGVKRVDSADVKIARNSDGKYVVWYHSKAYQLH